MATQDSKMQKFQLPENIYVYSESDFDFEKHIVKVKDFYKAWFEENTSLPYKIHYYVKGSLGIEEHILDLTEFITSEQGKNLISNIVPIILRQQNAFSYISCNEAWLKLFKENEQMNTDKAPSEYSDRQEVVIFTVANPNKSECEIWKIDRFEDRCVFTEKMMLPEGFFTGRLANFFNGADQNHGNEKYVN